MPTLSEPSSLACAIFCPALVLEAEVNGAWIKVLGVDQKRLLGQGAAGNRAIPATAPLRLQGELASHPDYVEAAVQFKLTEVPPPSDSSSPVEWRAEGIRTFAEFVAGPKAHWRPVQPAKSVLVCIWQLAGKPIRIYTLPLQNFSDKGLKSESPTFELTAEAASGNPVFLLFEDGQPLRKQIAGADATADRLGVLAALGQDAMVAAELRRIGSVPASEKGAPSLLHLAAQSGALQSLDALLQLGAEYKFARLGCVRTVSACPPRIQLRKELSRTSTPGRSCSRWGAAWALRWRRRSVRSQTTRCSGGFWRRCRA